MINLSAKNGPVGWNGLRFRHSKLAICVKLRCKQSKPKGHKSRKQLPGKTGPAEYGQKVRWKIGKK